MRTKQIISILLIIFSSINITFSQNTTNIIIEAAKDLAEKLKNEERNEENKIREVINDYDKTIKKLKIHFELITNEKNEKTELSAQLTEELANKFRNKNQEKSMNFDSYSITFEDIKEQINKKMNSDFVLSAKYLITNDTLRVYSINLTHNNGEIITLKDITYSDKSISLLEKLDSQILKSESVFVEFIQMQHSGELVDSIYLFLDNKKLNKKNIPSLGSVYQTEYNKEYSLSLELKQDAYVYLFFYSELDYKWNQYLFNFYPYYEPEKEKKEKGEFSLCKDCLVFSKTQGVEEELVYLKLVVLDSELDIAKYFKKEEKGGIVTQIADETKSKELYEYLKNYTGKIDTQNIILQF